MDYTKKQDGKTNFHQKVNNAFLKKSPSFLRAFEERGQKVEMVENSKGTICKNSKPKLCGSFGVKTGDYAYEKTSSYSEHSNTNTCTKIKTERGITLVALIITVVIMLILATVTISEAFGENGLIEQAKKARDMTTNSIARDQASLDRLMQEYSNIMAEDSDISGPSEGGGGTGGNSTAGENTIPGGDTGDEEPSIPETDSYVGYYADVDGDRAPDGIIYADLAVGGSGTGLGKAYTIPNEGGFKTFKKYEVTGTYSGNFGSGNIIAAMDGSEGDERFYVMALSDVVGGTQQFWSTTTTGSGSIVTSEDFGTGKANTAAMMAMARGSIGLWGQITSQVASGWYVPSELEWVAFAGEIVKNAYSSYGLSNRYWSSSQNTTNDAWCAYFYIGSVNNYIVSYDCYVRLGTTF